MTRIFARAFLLACLFCLLQSSNAMAQKPHVAIDGDHFTIDGQPRFLIMVSYFDGWRAPHVISCTDPNGTSLQCDFKWLKENGFDGVRIFPNWWMYRDLTDPTHPQDNWYWDDTLFELTRLRPGKLDQLKSILDAAGAAGLVVNLTFTRETICGLGRADAFSPNNCPSGQRMSFANYKARVLETMTALANESERFSHVIIDLQNERNLTGSDREFQNLSDQQVLELVNAIRGIGGPISRRLAASMATPSTTEVANGVDATDLNIAAWHEDRGGEWYSLTHARVGELRTRLAQVGLNLPITLQEPTPWQDDRNGAHMKTAVRGAKQACAASWTFHTRTAFNLTNSSFQRRLDLDLSQRQALQELKGAADGVAWGCNITPPSPPHLAVLDAPANNQTVTQPFILGGWAIDARAPTGTGVDTVHVWAWPANGGAPIFCGASYGGSRPDVGALYGARFTNSGFTIQVRGLPQGVYTFVASAHSTFTNTFDFNAIASNVTVLANPALAVDYPPQNGTVLRTFHVFGWAIDQASAAGTGVSTVHVWAYPANGGAAQFVGVVEYGSERPDVAAVFGPQFTNSGFHLLVNSLQPGTWDLAFFPYSTLNNYFFPATVRRVTVF
jgi:hypothetical protein